MDLIPRIPVAIFGETNNPINSSTRKKLVTAPTCPNSPGFTGSFVVLGWDSWIPKKKCGLGILVTNPGWIPSHPSGVQPGGDARFHPRWSPSFANLPLASWGPGGRSNMWKIHLSLDFWKLVITETETNSCVRPSTEQAQQEKK